MPSYPDDPLTFWDKGREGISLSDALQGATSRLSGADDPVLPALGQKLLYRIKVRFLYRLFIYRVEKHNSLEMHMQHRVDLVVFGE